MPETSDTAAGPIIAESPLALTENIIDCPDRRILISGTFHGGPGEPFSNRYAIEKEMPMLPGRINGLAPDGLLPLETMKEEVKRIAGLTPDDPKLDFMQWAIAKAKADHLFLIGADPANLVPSLCDIVIAENAKNRSLLDVYDERFKGVANSNEFKDLENKKKDLENYQKIANSLTVGFTAAAMGYGIMQMLKPMTRREFIKIAAGTTVGVATDLTLMAAKQQWEQMKRGYELMQKILLQKAGFSSEVMDKLDFDILGPVLPMVSSMLDSEGWKEIFGKPGIIPEDFRNTDFFKRESEINEALKIGLELRNAIAADVLTLPIKDIMPGFVSQGKANIVGAFGGYHLVLPKEKTIPGFIKDKVSREKTITTDLNALFQAIQNGVYGQVDINAVKEGFRHFGRSYTIDPQGNIKMFPFSVPTVAKAAS